ncbi:MAG TPA: type II toxin-antitoxin system VapC family toxin [Candidatus Saccharimonadales bacterium]|nr:type II toxin-antitoxin system VapC family toxin [Candidatus Saccharimonadales bacterium]
MKTILLDTSIIIDYLRMKNKKDQTVLFQLTEKKYAFAISLITYTELYSGRGVWEKEGAQKELEEALSYMKILPFEKDTAKKAGEIRAKFGTDILDAIIAATAFEHKIELVTLNTKDFEKINGLVLFKNFE